ncbi:hypothetical protein [Brachybacterium hainanense]|uniref:Uncharacterized protein n=1 Tax=Brachybacterium hainanense TaxID=1541174 RepID=A0ABV6RDF2_9MICO
MPSSAPSAADAGPRGLLAAAAAALLLLGASCTPDADEPVETTLPASAEDTAASDGGLSAPEASDGGGEPGDGVEEGTPAMRHAVLITAEVPDTRIDDAALAAILREQVGVEEDAPVECDGPLDLEQGDPQTCGGPVGPEDATQVVWIGQGVRVPAPDGAGSVPALLFSHDLELPDEAALALDRDRVLSALPMGSMYGAEPIPASQLGEDALRTLTSTSAITPPAGGFAEVSCGEDLDAAMFEPVECTAARTDGTEVAVQVLPGPFAGMDQGLIVSVPG